MFISSDGHSQQKAKICSRCGKKMIWDEGVVYTSNPPKYGYKCPECGNYEYDLIPGLGENTVQGEQEINSQKQLSVDDIRLIRDLMFEYDQEIRGAVGWPVILTEIDYCSEILKRFNAKK